MWGIDDVRGKDRAVLMKLVNKFYSDKVIFVIAGLRAEATAGAGYYLGRNWRELQKKFGQEPFGCVIEVDIEARYQTARVIHESTGPVPEKQPVLAEPPWETPSSEEEPIGAATYDSSLIALSSSPNQDSTLYRYGSSGSASRFPDDRE